MNEERKKERKGPTGWVFELVSYINVYQIDVVHTSLPVINITILYRNK